ncbi:hypothetical protein DM860_015284 [Cuscuta australis]|uniref:Uncharacterized protein n=1 Tax=Cuscuta australis TaxID=267555 RepID=A0A328DPX1_9ASTE|nr:hypothetical protein DM860_015284 [Cuscuta australis]
MFGRRWRNITTFPYFEESGCTQTGVDAPIRQWQLLLPAAIAPVSMSEQYLHGGDIELPTSGIEMTQRGNDAGMNDGSAGLGFWP